MRYNHRKYVRLFAAALLMTGMGLAGCDFLDNKPQDMLTTDNFYTSERAIEQNCYSLYAARTWSNFAMSFMWMAGDELSGDMFYDYDQEGQFYYASFGANNTYLTQGWKGLYRVISFANNIINDMPPAARKNHLSEDAILQGVAQARCVRAVAYYFLTEYWGPVTIVEDNLQMMNTPLYRHRQEDVYRFIVNDLEYAASALPSTAKVKGMATCWTAKGMLAKVYLTMGSHLSDARSTEYFAQAKAYAEDVIKNSGLQLSADYGTLFDISANNCDESLFAIQNMVAGYSYGNSRNSHWSRDTYVSDVAWGGGKGPTLSLQRAYHAHEAHYDPLHDATPEESAAAVPDLRRKWVYMTLDDYYPNINKANGGYTYKFVVRDDKGNKVETSNEVLAHMKKYIIGKSADTNGGVGDQQDAANNTYLLRLADVYMVYVETCIGAGNETDDALATDVYNRIHHDRAGLPKQAAPITYDMLLHERRCEFAFEGINFFDVKRLFYRDAARALSYLNSMDRNVTITPDDDVQNVSNENTRASYKYNTTFRDPIIITAEQMYLPVPGSEKTASPTLADEPIAYEFK